MSLSLSHPLIYLSHLSHSTSSLSPSQQEDDKHARKLLWSSNVHVAACVLKHFFLRVCERVCVCMCVRACVRAGVNVCVCVREREHALTHFLIFLQLSPPLLTNTLFQLFLEVLYLQEEEKEQYLSFLLKNLPR